MTGPLSRGLRGKQAGDAMAEYPLVFTYQDSVSGDGFLAGVEINGRGLMAQEDGKWWMLGVRPAALAASGETPDGAYLEFRNAYKAVLIDAAALASGFDAFKAEVERFFNERDEREERRWAEAGEAIQKKKVAVEAPFNAIKREAPGARPVRVKVERLDKQQRFTAAQNVLDSYALSAEAA